MSVSSNTNRITIPWGPGARTPAANLADEGKVRALITEVNQTATTYLTARDGHTDSGWSNDLDPSPARALRTYDGGKNLLYVSVETDQPEKRLRKQRPLSLDIQGGDEGLQVSAQWVDGNLVKLDRSAKNKWGETEQVSIVVNNNGTLTYSETTVEPEPTTVHYESPNRASYDDIRNF